MLFFGRQTLAELRVGSADTVCFGPKNSKHFPFNDVVANVFGGVFFLVVFFFLHS